MFFLNLKIRNSAFRPAFLKEKNLRNQSEIRTPNPFWQADHKISPNELKNI